VAWETLCRDRGLAADLTSQSYLPGAPGSFQSVQFGRGGQLMAAVAWDNTIRLYDLESRTRLGDPIGSTAYRGPAGTGWLSSSGESLVVNEEQGVVVWDLDPAAMLAAACQVAGRNLTKAEWTSYVSAERPHRTSCDIASSQG
jgi:hypothetical protein